MSTLTTHRKQYENESESEKEDKITSQSEISQSRIPGLTTDRAKQRYARVHSQECTLRRIESRHSTHYRKGKSYFDYTIRLPKKWADGLELKHHDSFMWSILNYDPVVLQLRKLSEGEEGEGGGTI